MQGVAGLVVMPHKTTDTRCSVGPATSTDVSVGEKDPSSPSKPATEGKVAADTTVNHVIEIRLKITTWLYFSTSVVNLRISK